MPNTRATHDAISRVARDAYGRIVATLASNTQDLAQAEDALADALEKALQKWPNTGVPKSPEAWLLTTARRRLIDKARHHQTATKAAPEIVLQHLEKVANQQDKTGWPLPDPRLKLLFVCAHPAIDHTVHAPLMLQTVLGVSADRIAPLFLVPVATMRQQLVRAKRKIRAAQIPFVAPEPDVLKDRLPSVLDAIYAAFAAGVETRDEGLIDEAVYLSDLCASLLPSEPEPKGLFALCLFQRARFSADRDDTGMFVPLSEQTTDRWNNDLIRQAEDVLRSASQQGPHGRYQIEAAIQSAHTYGRINHRNVSMAIVHLYEQLLTLAPSVGGTVGFAAAILAKGDAKTALAVLDDIRDRADAYQPYWVTRANILEAQGDIPGALNAYSIALSNTQDEALQAYLDMKAKTLQEKGSSIVVV